MPEGEILYINSVGGYRRRKVNLDPVRPITVMNHRDKQAHALDERPVHSKLDPIRFNSVDDLLAADSPKDPPRVEKWRIVCPDNAVWPISSYGLQEYHWLQKQQELGEEDLPHTLDELRGLKYQEYCEEATQRAIYEASRRDNNNSYQSWLTFALGTIACVVLLIIAAVILMYKLSGEPAPEVGPAAMMLLPILGAIAPKRSPREIADQAKQDLEEYWHNHYPEDEPPEDIHDEDEPVVRKKRPKIDPWIPGVVFDHPAIGGKIWDASLRYSEWMDCLPESCLYRPDIPRFRKMGALLGAASVGGILMSIGTQMAAFLPWGILGGLAGAGAGAVFGWFILAPILARKPYVMAARVIDDGGVRVLMPIEHNYCRTVSVNEYLDNLEAELARLASEDDEDGYTPTVFRATTFYEDMRAEDERAEVSSPPEMMQKVQIGLAALMAFGSIGLLIFASLATTPGGS